MDDFPQNITYETLFYQLDVYFSEQIGAINAYVKPSVAVSSPSKTSVNVGDSVSYTVMYSNADSINLSLRIFLSSSGTTFKTFEWLGLDLYNFKSS